MRTPRLGTARRRTSKTGGCDTVAETGHGGDRNSGGVASASEREEASGGREGGRLAAGIGSRVSDVSCRQSWTLGFQRLGDAESAVSSPVKLRARRSGGDCPRRKPASRALRRWTASM